ncbi:MAG TPA: MFS transporter [Thermomicrobiales bacterium]|nr:MFS transporter [Thermomicrobiales bacterium]
MRGHAGAVQPPTRPVPTPRAAGRRVLLTTSLVHLTNDACFALLYPLFPLIAADLHLSYAEVGLIKAAFSGASSVLQLPVGVLGERWGAGLLLLLGNAWVGAGLAGMALAGGYAVLLALALLAGLGGNAQHPLASAMVSRSFEGPRAATALGTLNFAGDLGKLLGPLAVGGVAVAFGWRPALALVGGVTAVLSLALLGGRRALLPEPPRESTLTTAGASAHGTARRFGALLLAGGLDNATRAAALTFLPFLLVRHGLPTALVSLLFSAIFAAGAAGKFACGWLGDRWGLFAVVAVTELATAAALVGFLAAPLAVVVPLALVLGFALNGTSSALMALVAQLVPVERRGHGYGVYYTATLVSGALAPLAYGALGDRAGLGTVFVAMALLTAAVVVVVLPLRGLLAAR